MNTSPDKTTKQKSRFLRIASRLAKLLLIAVVTVLVTSWLAITGLNYWLNKGSARDMIAASITEQTGAVVRLDSVAVSLPRGVKITGLKLLLPLGGGRNESEPSIELKEIRLRLSLLSLLYGTFKIKEVVVDGLVIHAKRKDGVLWTAGLQEFLALKAKANPPAAPPPKEADSTTGPFTMKDLNAVVGKVFVPFRIKIEEIGLRSFSFTFDDVSGKQKITEVAIGPLNMLFGMTAWMRSSHLWVRVEGGRLDKSLQFTYAGAGKTNVTKTFRLNTELTFDDLRRLNINAGTEDLPENLAVRLALLISNNFEQIDLQTLHLELGKLINFDFKTTLNFENGHLDRIGISSLGSAQFNLNGLRSYLKPFDVETSGALSIEKIKVAGLLDTSTLATLDKARLPMVELKLIGKDITVSQAQVTARSLNLNEELALIPDPQGGAAFSHSGRITLEAFSLKDAPKKGNTSQLGGPPLASLADLRVDSEIKATNITDIKRIGVQTLKVDVSIAELTAKPPTGGPIKTSLRANIDANTENLLSVVSLRTNLELGEDLKGGINIDCAAECQKIKLMATLAIPRIERLVALVAPALGPTAAQLPDIKRGSFSLKTDVSGETPPGSITKLAARFRKAKGTAHTEVHLKNFDVTEPKSKTIVEGVSFDLNVHGAIERQSLALTAKVKTLQTPALPKPLINNEFSLALRVEELARIFIDDISARVPSIGASVKATASAEINDAKEPRNINLNIQTVISAQNLTPGMAAIEASGDAKTEIHLQTPDLKEITVSGEASLHNFAVKIPQPKDAASDTPLISVENMNGVFPFRQKINLDDFKGKQPPAEAAKLPIEDPTAKKSPEPALAKVEPKAPEVVLSLDEKISNYLTRFKDSKSLADNRMKSESYGEVRPSTQQTAPISADRIAFKDLAITAVEIDAELAQNMFSLNQMVFSLLGGKVQATAQVTFDSTLRKARLTGQCTEIDTRKLADSFPKLRDKMASFSLLGSSPYVDGTFRLLYDAPSGDIAGGLEVTRIGKDQMRAMLLYIDPEENNPTITTMRKALSVGEVRQVSIPIRNGQIGLDLDVRLFSAPIPTPKLQKFPLAQLVRNFTGPSTPPPPQTIEKTNAATNEVTR